MEPYKYTFRGLYVFVFYPERKEVITDTVDGVPAINLCKFTPEDFALLSQYFANVHKYLEGEITADELESIEVF